MVGLEDETHPAIPKFREGRDRQRPQILAANTDVTGIGAVQTAEECLNLRDEKVKELSAPNPFT